MRLLKRDTHGPSCLVFKICIKNSAELARLWPAISSVALRPVKYQTGRLGTEEKVSMARCSALFCFQIAELVLKLIEIRVRVNTICREYRG